MKRSVDIDAILAPIPGDNPAGENLRYEPIYDEIKEARRADDVLLAEDLGGDLKTSDWDTVLTLSLEVLTEKSKDLQIASWLLEALAKTEGFEGVAVGLKIIKGLLTEFWDNLYPEIDDDDLDYRVGPLEFINEKVSPAVEEIPITDPKSSDGYSLLHWREAQRVSQAGAQEQQALLADGKLSFEDFESAVKKSSLHFYEQLHDVIKQCFVEFKEFDDVIDEKFRREAPRLSEFSKVIENAKRQVAKFLKEKGGGLESVAQDEEEQDQNKDAAATVSAHEANDVSTVPPEGGPGQPPQGMQNSSASDAAWTPMQVHRMLGSGGREDALWREALNLLKSSGMAASLEMLLAATCSSQSIREKNNSRLLMAKICIRAGRPDIAWPIAEELNKLVAEFNLEQWESPTWVADVYGVLYECLSGDNPSEEDQLRSNELLLKICNLDISKAVQYTT